MKLIAITQREENAEQYPETRNALDVRWHTLLWACDCLAIVLPNDVMIAAPLLSTVNLSGIILSGGGATHARTAVENLLIEHALLHHLPLLGVCHGMQMIQQYFGLPLKKLIGHVVESQSIFINQQAVSVNSYHDYGTTETTSELIVWATAQDGVVKAIRHHNKPLMGIMWHPERMDPFSQRDILLIKTFFAGTS